MISPTGGSTSVARPDPQQQQIQQQQVKERQIQADLQTQRNEDEQRNNERIEAQRADESNRVGRNVDISA
jgi:hypothetical protein